MTVLAVPDGKFQRGTDKGPPSPGACYLLTKARFSELFLFYTAPPITRVINRLARYI